MPSARNPGAGFVFAHELEGPARDQAQEPGCGGVLPPGPRVLQTAAGYTSGHVADPAYQRVCRHRTGHADAVEVWLDPAQVSYAELLQTFWAIHNPTTATARALTSAVSTDRRSPAMTPASWKPRSHHVTGSDPDGEF